jgi:hypothetical protein
MTRGACWVLAACLAAGWLLPAVAHAHVERFAVLIGNNRGEDHETPLRYAESDASRMYDVLRDLGSFEPMNMVLLKNENAETARKTLIAFNDRIRSAVALPNTQAVLLVYYSGHADEDSLHLGKTRLAVSELAQLARGSAANFRLVVLDACRSGALTRVKGGKVAAPFVLPDEQVPSDGLAFLTASAASEDAQESDELRASFFTHALVSGLLGAADRDADGAVVLDEAYRYAYETTLRATSRTLAGTQHPSFRYDLRGQGELVLTRPEAHSGERASLRFPPSMSFLVMRGHEEGAVLAEISERAQSRMLSVRPGSYFVRGRGPRVLFEGELAAPAGVITEVDTDDLERIEYARLVRKGTYGPGLAHGVELGGRVRSALPNADAPCFGAFVGYGIDFEDIGGRVRLSGCTSGFDNGYVEATTNAYDLELRVHHAWDLAWLSIDLGLGGGGSLFSQRFTSEGRAPDRDSFAPFLALGAAVSWELGYGLYSTLDFTAETHFLSVQEVGSEDGGTRASVALRSSFGLGKRF